MRFDSTRKLVEQHQSAVTFFLGVSLRDPLSLACYRALQQLCFNTSTQLIKMRMKRVKMERQPLVQVLQDSLQDGKTAGQFSGHDAAAVEQGKGQRQGQRQGQRSEGATAQGQRRSGPSHPLSAAAAQSAGK